MQQEYVVEKDGLTLRINKDKIGEHYSISGGDDRNPTWEEYKADYEEYFHPHLELLKEAIIQIGWVGMTGEQICNYYHFDFSTGEKIAYTWRAWGDLMQAIVDKKEGYMTYYM